MPSRQRYVVISIVCLAFIVGLVLSRAFGWLFSELNLQNPHFFGLHELALTSCLGYASALVLAVWVMLNQQTYALALDIADELARVTWPSRDETGHATLVVIVAVVVCSTYLGVVDAVWLWITNWILGVSSAV